MFEKVEKGTAVVLLCILICSLLPVIYLGRYNHPTGDDYYYGAETKAVLDQTGSLGAVLVEAVRGVARQYEIWQGTYSAMLLMHLPPNIFGERAYHLVTAAILFLLTGSVFYFTKPVFCTILKGSRSLWCILSSLLVLVCVQTVQWRDESFFWYNGSMYYTGYYALTLFLSGVVLRYLTGPKRRHVPMMLLLAAFLAGGNYVSLLPSLILLCLLTGVLIIKKSRFAVGVGCAAFVMAVGLLVSAAAPGNTARQSDMWRISAWKAVLKSVYQSLRYVTAWSGLWFWLAFLIAAPFLWKAFSKVRFRFRWPLFVTGFVFGIFCSMSCPTFYTMNSTGPARVLAIVYYGFTLMLFINYVYLLGYLHRVAQERQWIVKFVNRAPIASSVLLAAIVMLLAAQLARGEMSETTAYKAVELLASGEAAAYEQEYRERLAILEDDTILDVVFPPYAHQPEMLFVGDFTGDPEHETNQKIAEYFGKNTLRVKYD